MGQVLHGCAGTTEAVRRAIQLQQGSVGTLARRFGVSPTTIQKWRKRTTTADAAMGPKEPRSTVLAPESMVRCYANPGNIRILAAAPALAPGHLYLCERAGSGGQAARRVSGIVRKLVGEMGHLRSASRGE